MRAGPFAFPERLRRRGAPVLRCPALPPPPHPVPRAPCRRAPLPPRAPCRSYHRQMTLLLRNDLVIAGSYADNRVIW